MSIPEILKNMDLPDDLREVLCKAPSVTLVQDMDSLVEMACGGAGRDRYTVSYALPDGRELVEAEVVRVKNGIAANYTEPYMRRRDPDCMLVADELPSDKPRFDQRVGRDFAGVRADTLAWLAGQPLAVFGFEMGRPGIGGDALAVCPANAGFFAFALALLQGVVDFNALGRPFAPRTVIYVAPPFRHTVFEGKQAVVHNRGEVHEIFSYNLYPGPSAKKGVYGALIHQGVAEGWVTAHCSAVQVITPYDNIVCFMHEGASGGGKSEMLQQPHRMPDGRLLVGRNILTGEGRYVEIPRTCDLHPVCDDMGLCHPSFQEDNGRLWLTDAEQAWFVRVDHIQEYGVDHDIESVTVAPPAPILFMNIDVVAGGTALIWEHIEDAPGQRCPNPRVILPRKFFPGVDDEKVSIDVRSFGVRTPPCTAEKPSYGILGIMHVLPPALAWLWRLVSPRGHANPSIITTEQMTSEGVGSYWPFATGRRVDQANLLLQQFVDATATRYILTPSQHIGAWKTGFMPQWLARDYLARRGHARFRSDQIEPARCSLLGHALHSMRIEGASMPLWLLQVDQQPEVGPEAYDQGAAILTDFFHREIKKFLVDDLDELGRRIIACCLDGGTVTDYEALLPSEEQ